MNTKAKKDPNTKAKKDMDTKAIKPLKTKAVINMGDVHPKVRFMSADSKPLKTKALETYEAKTATQPVALPAPLKVKDINKKDVYVLQNMFNDLYNGRLAMVETSAVVNGRRAFVVKVQNWSKKELSKGICNLVTVGIDNLRIATNEDQGIDITAVNGMFAQAQIVVSYLESVTGLKAKHKKLTNGEFRWDLDSSKHDSITVDIEVSVSDEDIDVYGQLYIKNYNLEVEIDVCGAGDADATIKAIKKQVTEDVTKINNMAVLLNKFTE